MNEQQQKAYELADTIMNAAFSIMAPFKDRIPYAGLLRKHPFPDRKTPHRIKRARKKAARRQKALNIAFAVVRAASAAAQVSRITSTPYVDYKQGGELGAIGINGYRTSLPFQTD